jgi:hypothetical protein
MAMNQITQFRMGDGTEVALVDWSAMPHFSTLEVLHGSTVQQMDLFGYVVGNNVPTYAPVAYTPRSADDSDTDMQAPGSMASTEEMLVFAIRPEVFRLKVASASSPDFSNPANISGMTGGQPLPTAPMMAALQMQLILNFEISQKSFHRAGFGLYNFGAGVAAQGAAVAVSTFGQNGSPGVYAVQKFDVPVHIGGTEKFVDQSIVESADGWLS